MQSAAVSDMHAAVAVAFNTKAGEKSERWNGRLAELVSRRSGDTVDGHI